VEGDLFSSILTFMHSNDDNKRLAGVAALDALIGATSADEEKKITKFAKNLSDSLFKASNVDYEFLSEVTNALGKMALGAANVDYVESVVKRVPEWLKRDRSDRR
jgi:FKBP12-rapamycin complex-associated protein